MNFRILSDLHLEFHDFEPGIVPADAVILAGDIHTKLNAVPWILRHFPETPVLYILGNHEYYGEKIPRLVDKMRERCADTNIQVLENNWVEIGGIRIFGATLWSDMNLFGDSFLGSDAALAMNDFKRIRVSPSWRKFRPNDARRFHAQTLSQLSAFLSHDPRRSVVVTHHAPLMTSLPEERRTDPVSCAYASNLQALIEEWQPYAWVHGHIHQRSLYHLRSTIVTSNPRGYIGENTGFETECVLEVPTG